MIFKPDWEEAKRGLAAWWRGEALDRVALHVTAPLAQAAAAPAAQPADAAERWLSPDYRIAAAEERCARTWFGGEAFPYLDTNLGPGSLALYLGSEPLLARDTVWYLPCVRDLEQARALRFDPANRWWQETRRLVSEGLRRGEGRYLTSLPDIIENLDIVASLRGTSQTLEDLALDPQLVHVMQERVLDLYFRCYDELYALVSPQSGGCCFSAFHVWAPGRMAKLQCDFSAMISPAMFEEFVAPYLARQCEQLDYSVYHLDGPDAVKHLDLLMAIPRLTALQWTPGANQPGVGDPRWFGIYRRARQAGKSLLLLGVSPAEAQRLVEEFGPQGLLIGTAVASPAEGEQLLAAARAWKRRGA